MTDSLELAVVLFLTGLLAFLYGREVHNELVQNVMGLLTLLSIVLLGALTLIVAIT